MQVRIRYPRRTVEIGGRRSVQRLLLELGFDPESALVVRNGQLLTRDMVISEADEVEIIPAISGGQS